MVDMIHGPATIKHCDKIAKDYQEIIDNWAINELNSNIKRLTEPDKVNIKQQVAVAAIINYDFVTI